MTRPREHDPDKGGGKSMAMISVRNLYKSYGHTLAVSDLSFDVGATEVVGFLGPNGAGKSTTIRIIAGFLGASSGHVTINGHDVATERLAARALIGYMPENVPLYGELRVHEYLRYRAELKRIPRKSRDDEVQRVMGLAQVDDHGQVLIGDLSKGYRQRVGLADALLGAPPILVLDEPTAGMDPNQIREIRSLIRSLAGQHAVLLSTHIMSEVEATCDRAIIIDRGHLVAQGSIEQLRELRRSSEALLVVRGTQSKVEDVIEATRHGERVTFEDAHGLGDDVHRLRIRWKSESAPKVAMEETVAALVNAGLGVQDASNVKPSLEEVFALLTEQHGASVDTVDSTNGEDA